MPRSMALVTLVVVMAATACSSATNPDRGGRPMKLGPVDTGTGSLEAVRRQLEGTWDLVTLRSAPEPGATLVPVQARGTLTYDAYGAMTIDGRTTDASAPAAARAAPLLMFKGRAVIDAAKGELTLADLSGNADADAVLSPELRRKYAFVDDTLVLSSIDATGQVTSTAVWRKRP